MKKLTFLMVLLLTIALLLPTVSAGDGFNGFYRPAETPSPMEGIGAVALPAEKVVTPAGTYIVYDKKNLEGLSSVVGWPQEKNTKGEGLCTSSAMTTLLRRKQYLDTGAYSYDFSDVRTSLGASGTPNSKGRYKDCSFSFTPKKGWKHKNADGTTTVYYTKTSDSSTYRKASGLANMIDKHPEGVGIYTKYASGKYHAIILSDYVKDGDSYTFYAYDPADKGERLELSDTWVCRKCGSVSKLFKNIKKIFYIKD